MLTFRIMFIGELHVGQFINYRIVLTYTQNKDSEGCRHVARGRNSLRTYKKGKATLKLNNKSLLRNAYADLKQNYFGYLNYNQH